MPLFFSQSMVDETATALTTPLYFFSKKTSMLAGEVLFKVYAQFVQAFFRVYYASTVTYYCYDQAFKNKLYTRLYAIWKPCSLVLNYSNLDYKPCSL